MNKRLLTLTVASLIYTPALARSGPTKPTAKWVNCWDAREGLGRPIDFNAAYTCSLAERAWHEVAVMRMNGQGTPVDLNGAREALAMLPEPGETELRERQQLMAAIVARETAKAPLRPLRFCEDIDWSVDYHWNRCQDVLRRKTNEAEKRFLSDAKAALLPAANAAFKKVWAVYPAFRDAEGARIYQSCDGGSAASGAELNQQEFVREHFRAHYEALVKGAQASTMAKRSFAEADKELNTVYVADIRGHLGTGPDSQKAYASKAKAAQRLWLKYRDAWVAMVSAQQADRDQRVAAKQSAMALLTESRILELKHDPLHDE